MRFIKARRPQMKRLLIALTLVLLTLVCVTTVSAQSAPDPIAELKAAANQDPLVVAAIDRVVNGDTSDAVIGILKAEAAQNAKFAELMAKVPGWDLYFAPPAPPASTPTPPAPVATAPAAPAGAAAAQAAQAAAGAAAGYPTWFGWQAPPMVYQVGNCPPPIANIANGALISATLQFTDTALYVNVSRDMPSNIAFAGPGSESNALLSLGTGITKVELWIDGNASVYSIEMTKSTTGCALWQHTINQGGNWPSSLTGIPSGVVQYHAPYGIVEQPQGYDRWPDIVYGIRWWDSGGEHRYVNERLVIQHRVTAEIWWLQQNKLNPAAAAPPMGFWQKSSQGAAPAPSATVAPGNQPAPTAAPNNNISSACAPNKEIANGDNKTATACGWIKLSFWTPNVPEKAFLVYATSPITISGWNGSATAWDHKPSASELNMGNMGIANKDDVAKANIAISGDYEVFTP